MTIKYILYLHFKKKPYYFFYKKKLFDNILLISYNILIVKWSLHKIMVVIVPIIIVGGIGIMILLRVISNATINRAVEKDWQKKQAQLKEAADKRAALKSVGGTKFKDSLNNNPNENKWNKMKTNPKMSKKK